LEFQLKEWKKSLKRFLPELGLNYNSGSGKSPFGLDWAISIPSIQRRTDEQLPGYLEDDESDTYVLN
jgi:hypothetical protein